MVNWIQKINATHVFPPLLMKQSMLELVNHFQVAKCQGVPRLRGAGSQLLRISHLFDEVSTLRDNFYIYIYIYTSF